MNSKHCPYCHCSTKTIKHGVTTSDKPRYRCKNCGKTWTNKLRPEVSAKSLWHKFVFSNMNVHDLAKDRKKSEKQILRKLRSYIPPEIIPTDARVIAIDVTYFGRSWGILTVLNAEDGKALYCEPVEGHETLLDYEKAIKFLRKHSVFPEAAIVDGSKGVIHMLENYGMKVQLCHFHQISIITQCITRNPQLKPNIELKRIVSTLTKTDLESFSSQLVVWEERYKNWLKEKTIGDNGKWAYTHKRTRRAIRSLKTNLPNLFVYQEYPELRIPNTNNKIEGAHSELKRRLNNHRGLKKDQKIQFARIFFSDRTEV